MRDFACWRWLLIAAISAGFLQGLGNRSGETVVSIDMFVANVFAICFLFLVVCKEHENTSHTKKTNGKSKEHEQKLTEDDLRCKHMTR